LAARARTLRLRFLFAVIWPSAASTAGPPATSTPETNGLRTATRDRSPFASTEDRAGDGRERFGVGHAAGNRSDRLSLQQVTSQRRIIYLDEVTATLASQWLRYRHQHWPGSRNPHLLISQQTLPTPLNYFPREYS
jgi:hypothetical protein